MRMNLPKNPSRTRMKGLCSTLPWASLTSGSTIGIPVSALRMGVIVAVNARVSKLVPIMRGAALTRTPDHRDSPGARVTVGSSGFTVRYPSGSTASI